MFGNEPTGTAAKPSPSAGNRKRAAADENSFVTASSKCVGSKPRPPWPGAKSITSPPIGPVALARGMVQDHCGEWPGGPPDHEGNVCRGRIFSNPSKSFRSHSGLNLITTLWQSSREAASISSSQASAKLRSEEHTSELQSQF